MLPEDFADNTALALLFAVGIAAAFVAAGHLTNFLIGRALNLLARRHRSPLRSIELPVVGALRIPIALVVSLFGIRVGLSSLTQASTAPLEFVSNLNRLGEYAWIIALTVLACYTVSRVIRAIMR